MKLKDFDPFDSSLSIEDVIELSEKALKDDKEIFSSVVHQPIYQHHSAQQILSMKSAIEAGDSLALLLAIRICGNFSLTMPDWLSFEYNKRFDEVLNCRKSSWDDAFGKPYKGKKVHYLKQRRELRPIVFRRVLEIKRNQPEVAISKGLFEQVGEEFAIGATLAEELYYEGKKQFPFKIPS